MDAAAVTIPATATIEYHFMHNIHKRGQLYLDNVYNFSVALEDLHNLGRALVPDEQAAVVTARNNILVMRAKEIYILHGLAHDGGE